MGGSSCDHLMQVRCRMARGSAQSFLVRDTGYNHLQEAAVRNHFCPCYSLIEYTVTMSSLVLVMSLSLWAELCTNSVATSNGNKPYESMPGREKTARKTARKYASLCKIVAQNICMASRASCRTQGATRKTDHCHID